MKKIITLLSLILLVNLASAVPQIITTNFNLTVSSVPNGNLTNGNVYIFGEGGQMNNAFLVDGNCTFNYTLNSIPLVFSKDFNQNDSDMAVLIRSLNNYNNVTQQLMDCKTNLTICMNDAGYKGNYTQKSAELDICYRARDDYSNQIKTLNEQTASLTTWRNIGIGLGVIGIAAAAWLYRKQTIKKADNPYRAVSAAAIQH